MRAHSNIPLPVIRLWLASITMHGHSEGKYGRVGSNVENRIAWAKSV